MTEYDIPLMRPWITDEEHRLVTEVLDSGWLAEGDMARQLEREVEDYLGVEHAVVTSSCTAALHISLLAVDAPTRADLALVPDFTWPATAQAAYHAGFDPHLVDVGEDSYSVTEATLYPYTIRDVGVALPVSQFGHPLHPSVYDVLDSMETAVVEDAAPSLGAAWAGEPTGAQAHITCFSLYAAKHLTSGEGGIAVTDHDNLARRLRALKDFGMLDRETRYWGLNYNMSDLCAAVGLAQIRRLPDILARRRELAARYDEALAGIEGIEPPVVPDEAEHAYQSYAAVADRRDALLSYLDERGIQADIGTTALHNEPLLGGIAPNYAGTEHLDRSLIRLPLYHELTETHQDRVVVAIEEFYEA